MLESPGFDDGKIFLSEKNCTYAYAGKISFDLDAIVTESRTIR